MPERVTCPHCRRSAVLVLRSQRDPAGDYLCTGCDGLIRLDADGSVR